MDGPFPVRESPQVGDRMFDPFTRRRCHHRVEHRFQLLGETFRRILGRHPRDSHFGKGFVVKTNGVRAA